jgi:hypothetical protein
MRTFDYRFIGDELFAPMDEDLRSRTRQQPVVAADLARLLALRAALDEGYDVAVWCDADFLCFAPQQLSLPATDFGLGREVWVQHRRDQSSTLRAYVKVHNAFMFFRRDNTFLEFYIGAAQRLIRANAGTFSPQFLGPKFLTAIHNIAACPVVETAGMISPLVMADLARGGGQALDLFVEKSPRPIAAANLCASLNASGEVDDTLIEKVIQQLLAQGMPHQAAAISRPARE